MPKMENHSDCREDAMGTVAPEPKRPVLFRTWKPAVHFQAQPRLSPMRPRTEQHRRRMRGL
jgi:hypothetical protein